MRVEVTGEPDVDKIGGMWQVPPDKESEPSPSEGPKVQSISEIASIRTYAAQRIEFLVEGIIAAGTVTLVTGESGSGKTTVATAIASAVDRGEPFAGFEKMARVQRN
jgi:RecA/RadA recombinase